MGASPQAYMHIATGKKEKLGQRPIQISRGKKTSRRGSVGQSELGSAALRKAVWWDLRPCKPADALVFSSTALWTKIAFLRIA